MNQLKIVFMGTATFSEAVLKNLIQHDYNIVQVVSQPDRRVGRKKELKMPEVKVVALEHDIPVFQPQRRLSDSFRLESRFNYYSCLWTNDSTRSFRLPTSWMY